MSAAPAATTSPSATAARIRCRSSWSPRACRRKAAPPQLRRRATRRPGQQRARLGAEPPCRTGVLTCTDLCVPACPRGSPLAGRLAARPSASPPTRSCAATICCAGPGAGAVGADAQSVAAADLAQRLERLERMLNETEPVRLRAAAPAAAAGGAGPARPGGAASVPAARSGARLPQLGQSYAESQQLRRGEAGR
jgi:hypothetical protein